MIVKRSNEFCSFIMTTTIIMNSVCFKFSGRKEERVLFEILEVFIENEEGGISESKKSNLLKSGKLNWICFEIKT